MDAPKRHLNPPAVPSVRYKSNFIKTAVCELRFPTILELDRRAPSEFQTKIRKLYPFYEAAVIEQVGAGAPEEILKERRYLFRSKDKRWTVTLKNFSIALETSQYVDFGDFFSRLTQILASAKDLVDADFYTRIGLRYINVVPIEDGNLDGWINRDLIGPAVNGVLGTPDKFQSFIRGSIENGLFLIKHGLQDQTADSAAPKGYLLDFDYASENVEHAAVEARIKAFNQMNFSLFSWCLGEKAKNKLGPGTPK
ncbi:MAG: TIGR04255 family protein [Betaproteobacteria bacterium]|nr:TIGR04255 family protein [Betaproteobacteria bacterium]